MTSTDWPTYMGNIRRTGFRPEPFSDEVRLAWTQFIGENLWGSPAIIKNQVVISGHGIRSLDLHNGELIWIDEQFKASGGSATPAHVGESIFCPGLDHLTQRELETGKFIAKMEPGSMYSSPLIAFDRVCWPGTGQDKRSLYAANLNSEDIVWTHPFGAVIHFSPSANDELLFCASIQELHAIDPETGKGVWSWNTNGNKPVGTALLFNDRIFLGLEGFGLICLDSNSGDVLWKLELPFGLFAPPAINETNGILYGVDKHLRAIDTDSGKIIWISEEYGFNNSAPIVLNDHIFIGGGFDRGFYLFRAENGKLEWQHPTKDLVFSTAAYSDGRILIGSHDGFLYCFEGIY